MSYTQFRNNYLTEAENRLAAVNISTATTNELLAAGALYKMAAAIAEADLIGPSALRLLELMSGGQLQTWLQDAANRETFERILSSPEAMRAVAASSTAMQAVAASSTAMQAVAASSTAMQAVAASSTAMQAVAASSTAMPMQAVAASSTAMQAVAASSTAMQAVAASSTAMSALLANSAAWNTVVASSTAMQAVAASSTAMNAVLNDSVARGALWASSTALAAIQNAPAAVIDSLLTHPRVSMMNNNPSNLTSTFISGKSMTLRVRNTGGSDTNYLRDLAGGSGSGDDVFTTTTAWTTRVRAYSNLRHYNWSNNYPFQAYVVNMN
ncbi:hypothetical protein EDC36_12044 [Tepidimonas ignava]|uniref:Uncharacterized protein n=1 Tax=Tepidimonas ignava TaxID=114249 RepID=A0A4R3L4A4_9BURK|nr:hypothetical protein [Tepidimonas ignava]TCS94122.1 hypothetical protein EDC36_12044 [Tepidimonas ignava]